MKKRRQITVGLAVDKYEKLHQIKSGLEEALGRRVDWGTFLLTLVSPWSVETIVATILDAERKEESDLKLEWNSFTSYQITKEDLEDVVDKAANRIIRELKEHHTLNRDQSVGKGDEKP